MKRQRDAQVSKVYKSERRAFEKFCGFKDGELETMQQCQDFANKIVESVYWKSQKGLKRFKLTDGRGRGNACFKGKSDGHIRNMICLPKWARSRWVIIHEFAHFLTDTTHGSTTAWHGAIFCRHYVELTLELLGQEVCNRLETEFAVEGVRILRV